MRVSIKALLFAASALAPLAGAARAAEADATPSAETAATASAVQEVVVTAQKRSQRLEDVPVAITAISGDTLRQNEVSDVRDLVTLTPALRMDQTGIYTQPTVRGVGSGVTGPGASANVALYVDGFYQPSEIGTDFDLSNVTQAEVLKGPQGTLFGRNATGGAILVTTADPAFQPSGNASVSYRSFNDYRGELYLTGPLTDTLAANLSLYGRDSEGFKKDLITHAHDAPNETLDARLKLLWKPTDTLDFLLILQRSAITDPSPAAYSTYDGNSIGNAIPGVIYATNRFNTTMPSPPENYNLADSIDLKSDFKMNWATLTSYTGYRTEKDKEQSQLDRTSADLFTATWVQTERTFTQEFNLNSVGSGPLTWVAGLFYIYDNAGYPYFLFNGANSGGAAYVHTNAYAAFADATYEIVHNLYLTAGVRYSDETQTFDYDALAAAADGLPTSASYSHTWNSVNERAVLRYEFSPGSNVYASYSNGFKSGVYNTLSFSSTPVNPESINAYELGFKTAQNDWRLDASAFYYDYSNLQFTAYQFETIDGVSEDISVLENAAKATIYGGDAELAYKVTPDFNVRLGGAWTHARYDSFPGAIEYVPNTEVVGGQTLLIGNREVAANAAGKTLIRAPDFTATLGADYTTPLPEGRLTLSGNLYLSTRVYFDPTDSVSQPGYATLDLKATWTLPGDKWRISIFGTNVTDTKYVTQVAEDVFGYGAVYGTPAVVGIGVDTRF